MKYQIMFKILFILLARRKVSASALARDFGVSVRTIYRYVDEMTVAGVPIDVARGAAGGLSIPDSFKLPRGLLTKEEYARTVEALLAMLEQTHDGNLASALEKLTSQMKSEKFDMSVSGNILVDSGTWGDERKISEKLSLLSAATEDREALEIVYVDRSGESTRRVIHPHLLIYKQSIWYAYAYCTLRGEFRTFRVGRMRLVNRTGEFFERKSFLREDIPLNFWRNDREIEVVFAIAKETLPYAEDWLSVDNIYEEDGKHYAKVVLPDDEALIPTILSAGAGITVLSPASLAERVKKTAEKIAAAY